MNQPTEKRKKELLELELWSPNELAEFMGRPIGTIRNMVGRSEIPCLRRINSKLWYVNVKKFIEWFAEKPSVKKTKCKNVKGRRMT